jgi:hypothetical protein
LPEGGVLSIGVLGLAPAGRPRLRGDSLHDAPNDVITFTRGTFETAPIDDAYAAAAVVDESDLVQGASDDRYCRTSDAEHLSQELLREWKLITFNTVVRHQEPSRAPLLHGMAPIACRMLGDLDHHRLGIAQEQSVQAGGTPNLFQ